MYWKALVLFVHRLGQKVSENKFGFRDETGIKSTETRWTDCMVYASHMHTEYIPTEVQTSSWANCLTMNIINLALRYPPMYHFIKIVQWPIAQHKMLAGNGKIHTSLSSKPTIIILSILQVCPNIVSRIAGCCLLL